VFSRWVPFLATAVVLGANRTITPSLPLVRRAIVDEAAHVATTVLALDATRRRERRFLAAALVSTVLIDADHIPDTIFGWEGLTAGTPRPYTHSFSTIAAVLVISRLTSPSRRPLVDGLAFGLATHFLRDISDGSAGIPLLWPIKKSGVRLSASLQTPMIVAALYWRAKISLRG
jgi:hypothetical protein